MNGKERSFGGIGDYNKEFVGGNVGDTIVAANTFLELHSDTLQRALSNQRTLDSAKRLEIGEMNGGKKRRIGGGFGVGGELGIARHRQAVRRAQSSLQSTTEGTFVHIAFEHVVRCPHLKTSDSKFFIGGVGKKY